MWYHALCIPEQASVLRTLVAHSKQEARTAALVTLHKQAMGTEVVENSVIQAMSTGNAVQSTEALAPLVGRKVADVPRIVCLKMARRDADAAGWEDHCRCIIGIVRTPSAVSPPKLHSFAIAPHSLQPSPTSKMVVLHSRASVELNGDACDMRVGKSVPAVEECMAALHTLRSEQARVVGAAATKERVLEKAVGDGSGTPLAPNMSGITRAVVSLSMTMRVHPESIRCAMALSSEMHGVSTAGRDLCAQHGSGGECAIGQRRVVLAETCAHTAQAAQAVVDKRTEPLCLPASKLALGINIQELLMKFRSATVATRKNKQTATRGSSRGVNGGGGKKDAAIGASEAPNLIDSEPLPMLMITDLTLQARASAVDEVLGSLPTHARRPLDFCGTPLPEPTFTMPVDAAVHIVGQSPIRLPELLRRTECARHAIALVLCASSHASLIDDLGASVATGYATSNLNNSKRISVGDTTTRINTTAYDAWFCGIDGLKVLNENNRYAGCYPAGLDHGLVPPGLAAKNLGSDWRKNGTMALSAEMADRVNLQAAKHSYVRIGRTQYTKTPELTHGISHCLYVGMHESVQDVATAYEEARSISGLAEQHPNTQAGLHVMPFSVYSQQLAPFLECMSDQTSRHSFRDPTHFANGRAYLATSTAEEDALFTDAEGAGIFPRACQASGGDNVWATGLENAASFCNALDAIILLAREAHRRLHPADADLPPAQGAPRWAETFLQVADALHGPAVERTAPGAPADAAVMVLKAVLLALGPMYCASWRINEPIVPDCYARAVPVQERLWRATGEAGTIEGLVGSELAQDARRRWEGFRGNDLTRRPGAWAYAVRDLFVARATQDGAHEIADATVARHRELVTRCVKAAFLVHSPDGVSPPLPPCPAHKCTSPETVNAATFLPNWSTTGAELEYDAHGALVGVVPHQLRQIYALLIGASMPDLDEVQAYRNEGNLSLRMSSAADILKQDGTARTTKAESVTQCEADSGGFGTHNAKLLDCKRQRASFDKNTELVLPVLCRCTPPLPYARRMRGLAGLTTQRRIQEETLCQRNGPMKVKAVRTMHAAAASKLNEKTHAAEY